jgi:hypothetical protein
MAKTGHSQALRPSQPRARNQTRPKVSSATSEVDGAAIRVGVAATGAGRAALEARCDRGLALRGHAAATLEVPRVSEWGREVRRDWTMGGTDRWVPSLSNGGA